MARIKGIDLVNLRTLFQQKPPAVLKQFLSLLTEEEQAVYLTTVVTSWNPVEVQNAIFVKAGEFLFPQDQEKYVTLGKTVSELSYTGIYKVFLRVLYPEIVVQRWVTLWHLHHDTGKPAYTVVNDKHVQLIVRNYPELPQTIRQMITEHMLKILELVGIKQGTVVLNEDVPDSWRWDIVWGK